MNNEAACSRYSDFAVYRCIVGNVVLVRAKRQRVATENMITAEAKEALTGSLLGDKDWEEKRHQLLLQKMQLEMEREKLQARLAEQEERLGRQTEQLRQSRLHHSR
ncbi:hypothetical protein XENOCAPTIV_028489 [Xenoophorus captivus]|uniref:Uncharacterized protein n=1 Tax=Xenoophorus captivus TaxID=1517983 RepID=A0ABV0QDA2_9TELE